MSAAITTVTGRRVWDSRGRPTVEVEVRAEGGAVGRAIAPAGASTGSGEAVDLRDGGDAFGGWDVRGAVGGVNAEIAGALRGLDVADQAGIDGVLVDLDGTPDRSRLGGNALVATSLAVAWAAAASRDLPLWRHLADASGATPSLPVPEIQIFGGGAHAARRTDVQDFMVVPLGAASFAEGLDRVAEVYRAAGALMQRRGSVMGVADEGGWWPDFATNDDALATLTASIEAAGFGFDEVAISLDIAASEFGRDGRYTLGLDGTALRREEWMDVLLSWLDRYPIRSIEDPFAEDDDAGFAAFTAAVGDRLQVVADDYTVTDAARVERAVSLGVANTLLVKVNQAGTLTETRRAFEAARAAGWDTIVSARSGESEDVSIVHIAVGWDARYLKVGSFARSERMAKWNEGLRIEAALTAG